MRLPYANRLGQRVGDELGIPVYLYEQAAARPERANLENIRRGEFEGLKEEIATDPERDARFWTIQIRSRRGDGHRGAQLSDRLQRISHHGSGRDREEDRQNHPAFFRRAALMSRRLGLLVEGRAQVSINMTDYHKTPIALVVETIRREAQRYGVGIHHSEVVGLLPQDALVDAAVWYTQLDGFDKGQILEIPDVR
jgi:glutamate formiminotransferase / formiminotetrahydrofolate cyclodeaminase